MNVHFLRTRFFSFLNQRVYRVDRNDGGDLFFILCLYIRKLIGMYTSVCTLRIFLPPTPYKHWCIQIVVECSGFVESFFDKKDVEILKRLVFLLLRRHVSWCRNNKNTSLFRISASFLSKNNSSSRNRSKYSTKCLIILLQNLHIRFFCLYLNRITAAELTPNLPSPPTSSYTPN